MALKGRRVLFISYNGMLDPLGQSQVIPYLRELSRTEGVHFTLLSFEREAAFTTEGQGRSENLKRELSEDDIEWHWLPYHQKPSLPATIYDVLAGARYAGRLIKRHRIELVHARSHIPATMALMLKKRFGVKFIFDVRGLMAEEYVDAGHWRAGSLPHRLTKRMERRILAAADGVVTLTESIWPVIREWEGLHGRAVPHRVVPCCADLEVFRFDAGERARRRAEMSLGDHFVLVYSGSIGGWYLLREMADFFAALSKKRPEAHFLWLTRGAPELVQSAMRERGIDDERYTIKAAESADVPSYLSASDAGIAFYRPGFSKLATSPVKVTEYLACGLPVILNTGIGDSDALITSERAGALVQDFTAEEYAKAAASLLDLVAEAESTRRRLRQTASKYFDLHAVGLRRYAQLYEEVWSLESGV